MSYFIAVAGNMGVGKSELTQRLAAKLGWQAFLEPAAQNPYLPDFYADMPRWAFHSQTFFLAHRLREHQALLARGEPAIQDRSVYENAEVFARLLYRRGNLTERDWQTYYELYQTLVALLPPPTLIIYLEASVPTLVSRIEERGRKFEQDIDVAYLTELNSYYDEWAKTTKVAPLLRVPTDHRNFVKDDNELERLTNEIYRMLPMQQLPFGKPSGNATPDLAIPKPYAKVSAP